jgi:predicted TIM-barrel fold metal-dependent hydrolase
MSAFNPAANTAVNWEIPKAACDCHVHVYLDYAAYPMSPARVYTPPIATEADLAAVQKFLRMERTVIVQPSNYGTDNRATLQGVKFLGLDRARAVVVIDRALSDRDLDELARQGARGVRVNLELDGIHDPAEAGKRLKATAQKIKRLGWHIQTYTQLKLIAALKNELMDLPVPLVIDHFGMAQAGHGMNQPGLDALLALVKAGNTYVKISAAYRSSQQAPDFADITPLAHALITANTDRIVWGTDWPHPDGSKVPGRKNTDIAPYLSVNDGAILNQLPVWEPNAAIRKKILVDNPARLYGF